MASDKRGGLALAIELDVDSEGGGQQITEVAAATVIKVQQSNLRLLLQMFLGSNQPLRIAAIDLNLIHVRQNRKRVGKSAM